MAAARAATVRGHLVSCFISPHVLGNKDALEILQAGAKIYPWQRGAAHSSFFERLGRKFFRVGPQKVNFWKKNLPQDVDIYCINQGGAFCATLMDDLPEVLLKTEKPFICLARSDRVVHSMTSEWRRKARNFFGKCANYVTPCQANLESASRMLAMSLHGMPLHSPISDFSETVEGWPSSEVLEMACVGRLLVRDKGQDILLAALASDIWKNRLFRLSFYGDGCDVEYLKQLVEMYKLSDKVVFVGRVQNSAQAWDKSHIAILPSISEGTPQAMLEAMLCRRPVVATAVGGIPEWLVDGHNGFLAESPTIEYLERALERAWMNRAHLCEMGENARSSYLAKYNPNPAKALLDILVANSKTIFQ